MRRKPNVSTGSQTINMPEELHRYGLRRLVADTAVHPRFWTGPLQISASSRETQLVGCLSALLRLAQM